MSRNKPNAPERYAFFIGGSGARTYKSFIHACAAGAVSAKKVNAILLDADDENPACRDSLRLYELYLKNRAMLEKVRSGHKSASASRPFSCDLRMFPRANRSQTNPFRTISPLQVDITHLDGVAGFDRTQNRALKWFYTERERGQDLRNGFYAHPNIGCIFFQNLDENDDMRECLSDIRDNLEAGREVYISIIGSVFGGTGAAGIPSVLKVIRDYCGSASDEKLRNLHFSAVLITPYFSVVGNSGGNGNIEINSQKFFGCTRSALRYYKFKNELERIYLVGQKTLDPVNPHYADGGEEQKNKPHIVELFAAMAVAHFFNQQPNPRADGKSPQTRNNTQILGRILDPTMEKIQWSDLDFAFHSLADLLRAQAVLEKEIFPYANDRQEQGLGIYQWYKGYYMDDDESQRQKEILHAYNQEFLQWMYALQYKQEGERSAGWERNNDILLCGDMIERLAIPDPDSEDDQFDWAAVEENFNSLISGNLRHTVKKVFLILSVLSFLTSPFSVLNLCDLFIDLFEVVSEKK